MPKKSSKKKVIIFLKDSHEVHLHLTLKEANLLIDQVYSVFSGEFDDNCIEVVTNDPEIGGETILLKADEILYVRTQEELSDE